VGHRLLHLGIDEAGYGPRVGPLCVGSALLALDGDLPQQLEHSYKVPDGWALLRHAVCHAADRDARRIAIDDSKRLLKRARGVPNTTALELGVRTFLALADQQTTDWVSLFAALNCSELPALWSCENFPALHHTRTRIEIMANPLRRAARDASVRCLGIRCACMDAQTLNERIHATGSKPAVSFELVAQHIESALRLQVPMWITVDRQGGRTSYQRVLREHFPYLAITEKHREPERSVYHLRQHDGPDCWIEFRTQAEDHALPVALASMAAKLVREGSMHRFNAYWCKRIPELKPTAGYGLDAKRWLHDVAASSESDQLPQLVRIR
jgi:ribonuclease HII